MQNSLDPKLIRRLLRPLERPGVIERSMSWEIVRRSRNFTNRLPLVSQITQRLHPKIRFQEEQTPIVYAQPLPQENPTTVTTSAELVQSSTSQPTVVQAKLLTGSDRPNLNTNPHKSGATQINLNPSLQSSPNLVYTREKFPTNPTAETFYPATSLDLPPSHQLTVVQAKLLRGNDRSYPNKSPEQPVNLTPFSPENSHLVYGREQFPTNPTAETLSPLLAQPSNSQNLVVQAKLMTGSDRSYPNQSPEKSVNLTPFSPENSHLVYQTEQLQTNPTAETLSPATSLDLPPNHQLTVVQAKLLTGSDRSLVQSNPIVTSTPLPIQTLPFQQNLSSNSSDLSGKTETKYLALKPENLLEETLPKSQIPNSIGWSGLETPLIFSSASVNSKSANTESVNPELGVPNLSITERVRTEAIPQTPRLSKEVSPNIQVEQISNIQPNQPEQSKIESQINLDALTDKIEYKLRQRLIVESERRGRITWS